MEYGKGGNKLKYPMTSMQKAYYIGRQIAEISTKVLYSVVMNKDIRRLETALNKVVMEQPALRTVFTDTYEQEVIEHPEYYHIREEDITGLTAEEQEKYLDEVFEAEKKNNSDPSVWPLFSVSAYKTGEAEYTMFIEFDMLVCDGISFKIFAEQLRKHYNDENYFVPENMAFFDYVTRKTSKDAQYEKDRKFWEKKIADFPSAPLFGTEYSIRQSVFSRKSLTLSEKRLNEIEAEANKHHVTAPTYLLAAYAKTVALYSGQKRFTIDLPVFDRNEKEMSVIGDFTAVILLAIENAGKDFWELCRDVQIGTIEAMMHKRVDGTEIMEMLSAEHGKDRALFPIVFTSMIYKNMLLNMDMNNKIRGYSQTSNVYLDCQISFDNGRLTVNWDYDSGYFKEQLISDMFGTFSAFLEGRTESIGVSEEYIEKVKKYNDVRNDEFRGKELLSGILEKMAEYPERTAVKDSEKSWTYSQLKDYSAAACEYFRSKGMNKGSKVIISGCRKCETVGCILGILMGGGVYVPIDPSMPSERKKYIIDLCDGIYADESEIAAIKAEVIHLQPCEISSDDEAYIIFTSGSTGVPKGVVITHGAAMNTIAALNRLFDVSEKDVFLCVSSFGFDLSVYDIFGSLSEGAELVITEDSRDVCGLHRYISDEGVTVLNIVPALMQIYIDSLDKKKYSFENSDEVDFDDRESLRTVIMSGDNIPPSLPAKIYEAYENCRVYSGGGATECGIWSIYYPIPKKWDTSVKIPYGYPLPNQGIYIFDDNMELCPENTPGNICISGEGLAKGYFGDDEKTKAAFVESGKFGRVYITGDLGVMNSEGYVDFNGRKDTQIKLNGFRIELGEIETVFKHNKLIDQCAAVLKKNRYDHQIIAVYYTASVQLSSDDLKSEVSESLPSYMIPSVISQLDEMPLTANNKIDRKKLINMNDAVEISHKKEELTDKEKNISDILFRSTGFKDISVNEDLFEVGFDSLNAISFYSELKENYDISLNMIFQYHTIRELAAKLNVRDDKKQLEHIERMKRQAVFENDDKEAQGKLTEAYTEYLNKTDKEVPVFTGRINNERTHSGMKVLVTGATGFIGAYLLKTLLEQTDFHIYCIVRGEDVSAKIEDNLGFYFGSGYYTDNKSRIMVIHGDIAEDKMGISDEVYGMLLEQVDIVYHCAAKVSHYGIKEDFIRNNVDASENILRFCLGSAKSKCVIVSTTRLLFTDKEQDYYLYTEDTQAESCHPRELYAESKIEVEKLVKRYRELGVNASIMRVGTVMAEYSTGKFQKNIDTNAFYIVMKALFKLKMFPAIETEILDFSFVDSVAEAMLRLSVDYDCCNETFHIFNNDKLSEVDFYTLLHKAGLPDDIKLLPFDEYYDAIYDMYINHKNKLIIDDILLHAGTYISFDGDISMTAADRTEMILKMTGFRWPKADEIYVKKMLDYGKSIGYFEFAD